MQQPHVRGQGLPRTRPAARSARVDARTGGKYKAAGIMNRGVAVVDMKLEVVLMMMAGPGVVPNTREL